MFRGNLHSGDIVKCPPGHVYHNRYNHVIIDGYVYGRVKKTIPDSDNDIKVNLIDPSGEYDYDVTYFDADALILSDEDELDSLTESEPDPEIESRLNEDRDDKDSLAVLEEEKENLIQMQNLQSRTVEPGVLELPVSMVTSAKNSQQWAVKVDHPVLGELTSFFEKPLAGWSDDYKIIRLMEAYNIHDGNPYKLQQKDVYLKLVGDNPESQSDWKIVKPTEVGSYSPDSDSDDGLVSRLLG